MAWVDAVVPGGMHCVSLYLRHSEGLSADSTAVLDQLAVVIESLRGPWIVAGDWNLIPQILTASKWLRVVHGIVFATPLPTCNNATYDFFRRAPGAGDVGGWRPAGTGCRP